MEDTVFKVQVRTFPSKGRARVHIDALDQIGLKEGDSALIVNLSSSKEVKVAIVADSLVESGYIRMSPEDMTELSILENDEVVVRRYIPIGEKISKNLKDGTDNVKKSLGDTKDTISDKIGSASHGITESASEAFGKVGDSLPTRDDLSGVVERAKLHLAPGEEKKLKQMLEKNEGAIKSYKVSQNYKEISGTGGISLPDEVLIAAVQRGEKVIIPGPGLKLESEDIVFLVGKEKGLKEAKLIFEE